MRKFFAVEGPRGTGRAACRPYPRDGPGVSEAEARSIAVPTLVIGNGIDARASARLRPDAGRRDSRRAACRNHAQGDGQRRATSPSSAPRCRRSSAGICQLRRIFILTASNSVRRTPIGSSDCPETGCSPRCRCGRRTSAGWPTTSRRVEAFDRHIPHRRGRRPFLAGAAVLPRPRRGRAPRHGKAAARPSDGGRRDPAEPDRAVRRCRRRPDQRARRERRCCRSPGAHRGEGARSPASCCSCIRRLLPPHPSSTASAC